MSHLRVPRLLSSAGGQCEQSRDILKEMGTNQYVGGHNEKFSRAKKKKKTLCSPVKIDVSQDRISESMMTGKLIINPLDSLPASHCEK